MTKFPIILQLDSSDCGASCVRMIAKYYGKDYSINYLREHCYTSRKGVSMMAMSDTAEELGFKTISARFSFQKLINEVPLPCILHWGQDHFVVLYKISKSLLSKKTILYVADPGKGLTTYNEDEFKQKWLSTKTFDEDKGVAMIFETTNSFYQKDSIQSETKGIKFLFSYFNRYRKYFFQLILGLLIASFLQLLFPFLTQSIVDIGIDGKDIDFIYLVLIAQMVIVISRMIVEFIRNWIMLHISARINISLVSDFFIKLMKLPMKFFDTRLTGDILQRIEDHERVESIVTSHSLEIIFSFFTLIIFSFVLWSYNLLIFLVFLLGSSLYALWVVFFLKKRKEIDYKYFEQKGKNQSATFQLIHGMQEIKLQNYEKQKRWEWEDIQVDLFKVNISALKLEHIRESGNIFIEETKNIVITIIAATSVINGDMTLGMMLATQYIIGQLSMPIDQMVSFIHSYQDAKISLERINEIHNKEDENTGKEQYTPVFQNNTINIKNLTYQYEGPHSKKVLNNITLTIPEGKVTAIVGASGSGKTTLIKMLLQYYEAIDGEILIDNHNINNLNTVWWRNTCGAVMQDGFVFSETIAQNIALTNLDDIDKDKLKQAAKIANIHDTISEMPLKYNTIVGSEGQNLSQGQKQRLLIARAVYKNPDYIFFDEATNALDANNERVIVENLQEFYTGKTVIIVAHRLSTVKNADQIIVLNDGEIAEIGNHTELTTKKGPYYQLVKNQLELGN